MMSPRKLAFLALAGIAIIAGNANDTVQAQAPAPAPTLSETDLYSRAEALVSAVIAGRAEEVGRTFNEEMTRAIQPDKLTEAWKTLEMQAGPYKGISGRRLIDSPPYRVVVLDVAFGQLPLDLRVPFDADGKVAGFRLAPRLAPIPTAPAPAYGDPAKTEERTVTVGAGEWALPGILTLPKGKGPFPAVVLVHGSGPADRDETVGAIKPFRDFAAGLAARGIAVLRYDKRTFAHREKIGEQARPFTVREETIDDALAAAALLRGTPEVDPARVFVLGHSLGGLVAPRIGAADPKIAGFILLAAPAVPFHELLVAQFTHIFSADGQLSDLEKAQIERVRRQVEKVDSPDLSASTPEADLPLGIPAPYWLDLRGYDALAAAGALQRPMLILQGGRDYQVPAENLDRWKAALGKNPKIRFQLFPPLDHLFVAGEGVSAPADYERPANVAPEVVQTIAGWILKE